MSDYSQEESISNSDDTKKKGKKQKPKEEKIAYITKTRLKTEYLLSDKDLKNFEFIERPNPHWRSGSSMILYDKEEVLGYVKELHGATTDEELNQILTELRDKKKEKSEIRKAKIRETKEKKQAERKRVLSEALSAAGLELRGDSALCSQYIDNTLTGKWTVHSIVERMCEMKYLYEYCNFDKVYKECKKRRDEDIRRMQENDDSEYDRWTEEMMFHPENFETIFEEAEEEVLSNLKGGRYPKIFPWQATGANENEGV